MSMTEGFHDNFVNRMKGFLPGISLDCVVFGYHERSLKVLLLRYRNTQAWALPGGFLPGDREMDEVASEILDERTGVGDIFLQQFQTFASLDRGWESNELSSRVFERLLGQWPEDAVPSLKAWLGQRFISTGYVALVESERVVPKPDALSEECRWIAVDELPPLVLDHLHIIESALRFMRTRMNYLPIGRSLLSQRFTMSELQSLYEAILGKSLDRGNFQRKMLKLGVLVRHEKLMTGAANKAPYLYSIDEEVYDRLLRDGIGFS